MVTILYNASKLIGVALPHLFQLKGKTVSFVLKLLFYTSSLTQK